MYTNKDYEKALKFTKNALRNLVVVVFITIVMLIWGHESLHTIFLVILAYFIFDFTMEFLSLRKIKRDLKE